MLPTFNTICLQLSYFSCFDIVACSALCTGWLKMLEYRHLWKQYCADLQLPLPLWSLHELRRYAAALVRMDRCWLKYKVYDVCPYFKGISVLTHELVAGARAFSGVVQPWRHREMGISTALRKVLADISNTIGAVPYDYVAALQSAWQPNETCALGDIILILNGAPVIKDVCKDPVTNLYAMCIGYICPNGFGGHRFGIDLETYELIMCFRVTTCSRTGMHTADAVSYHVVCHNQIVFGDPGPFGFEHAAAAIARLRTNVYDLLEIATPPKHVGAAHEHWREFIDTVAIYSYASYAVLFEACVESITLARQELRGGCFTPCYKYWLGPGSDTDTDFEEELAFSVTAHGRLQQY